MNRVPPIPHRASLLGPLIGRERELAVTHDLLRREDVRLVTITGPGGIGKTRLAMQVAADMKDVFADGVHIVSLGDVTEAARVITAIAGALGISEAGNHSMRDAFLSMFHDAEALLVIENFEHVLPAAPLLTDALSSCSRLKILVTSRSMLRVAGEQAVPVPPLALPDANTSESFELASRLAAVRLFAARAHAASADFTLSSENTSIVADICRHLDGVPLAIELAAARINHLPLNTLRERLEKRLPLLTGGPRDQPSRLQTMHNAIAWSHALLPLKKQALFRRLSVFQGSFSLDAAESICTGPERSTGSPSVLDGIAELVNASLLQPEIGLTHSARYRMLGTIREFAQERLIASGEYPMIRRQHADYFVSLAERLQPAPFLPAGKLELIMLESEYANVQAALDWLAETHADDDYRRIASALSWYWFINGHIHDGKRWLERALQHDNDAPPEIRARIAMMLGIIAMAQGDFPRADELVTEGLSLSLSNDDPLGTIQAHISVGVVATARVEYARAERHLEQALDLANALDDPRQASALASSALANLGVAVRSQGRLEDAVGIHEEALAAQREVGFTSGEIHSLMDLGDVTREQGEHSRAAAFYREGLELAGDHREHRVVADALDGLACTAVTRGKMVHATHLFAAADKLRNRTGVTVWLSEIASITRQSIAVAHSHLGEESFELAWATGRARSLDEAITEAIGEHQSQAPTANITLTRREREVLTSLVAGLTDRQIADSLFLSVRTVEHHVARIFVKLGVKTRTAAATTAIANGLMAPASSTETR